MNRDELEAAIWRALRGLKAPPGGRPRTAVVDEILAAADAYTGRRPRAPVHWRRHGQPACGRHRNGATRQAPDPAAVTCPRCRELLLEAS